ncbi:MAG: response regulator, partial [Acaryochloridaceae cyanobacterium RL_2_7]|nr:response regulator [Acaryochloridaceae cyanobacterium RL_2_7]
TLRQGGYEVIHAKDGLDALEQLQSQPLQASRVDLIISDVAMPRMNGLEFLRRCRQDDALKALPIAMLSNCDSTTHSELAIKEGANAYLTKPYVEAVFLDKISKLIEAAASLDS